MCLLALPGLVRDPRLGRGGRAQSERGVRDPGARHQQAPDGVDAAQRALEPLALGLHDHGSHQGEHARGRRVAQDRQAQPGGPGGQRVHRSVGRRREASARGGQHQPESADARPRHHGARRARTAHSVQVKSDQWLFLLRTYMYLQGY